MGWLGVGEPFGAGTPSGPLSEACAGRALACGPRELKIHPGMTYTTLQKYDTDQHTPLWPWPRKFSLLMLSHAVRQEGWQCGGQAVHERGPAAVGCSIW